MNIELKKIEEGLIPIYENNSKERLINARELFYALRKETKTKFSDWIKQRINQYEFAENEEFFKVRNFTTVGNLKRFQLDYYLTIDMSKELCMVENNEIGRKIGIYSENKIPHSNIIGAIARQLGYKVGYKHYYEDEKIAIIKDISKNEYWQVYYKPKAVKEIEKWFNENKKEIYYEIQYVKNSKKGKIGEIKEKGYRIENISYKIE